ncbi:hypothetical protein L484_020389 [Morus notabilis]|uniref:Uncharacterized protein n=1 Tax=Morus notabilis TaxID=981085 RepID=W9RQR0_9ROSA|nr:hypothetical protein L484_020389 [Morus notabilis]
MYLQDHEREGRNATGVVDDGNEAVELRCGSKISEIVEDGFSRGLHEEHSFRVAIDFDTVVVLVPAEAAGQRVEGDKEDLNFAS